MRDLAQGLGVDPRQRHRAYIVEYLKILPSAAEIRAALKDMGIGPRELLRRRGSPYDDLGLGKPNGRTLN